MNPQAHRLIFNQSRGSLMVVGENARSAGGGGCSATRRRRRACRVTHAHTTTESSSSKSSSGSIGVGFQLGAGGAGVGVTASASKATGQGAGNSTSTTNTQVSGQRVNISSGGDTTLKGAVVSGNQVTAKVGGDLNIESLQDQSQYNERSKSAGGSVTFGAGAGASLSLGKTQIDSDYQSVGEQSAIRAGDGGFQVSVGGNTSLTGGQITSTQAAIDNQQNSFSTAGTLTTTDLQNSASYQAKSASVGLGTSGDKVSPSGMGIGSDSGAASSTTTAGISGIAGNAAARTGDAETGIGQIFDQERVKAEVAAQVAITAEFGKQASKVVGNYAQVQYDKAEAAGDQEGMAAWAEGGTNRVALHAVVGGLTGGAAGAVGSAAASAAAPGIDELQGQLQESLKSAGLGDEASKAIASLAGGATAAGIGAAASGGTAAGAATAFNADMNNRQLHPNERQLAKELARKSGGKYTVEEIENALRNAGNTERGESVIAGMVVDPKTRDAIYDNGAVWTVGENGLLVQVLAPQPPADLVAFVHANTADTYNWYTPSAGSAAPANAPRDRLTDMPLDDKGRYSRAVVLDGKVYEPKFHSCASVECSRNNANLDLSDPATQAYVRALDQQVLKDIGTGVTLGSLVTPVGVPGAALAVIGGLATVGEVAVSDTPGETAIDEGIKTGAESGAEWIFRNILGHTPSAAARAAALINLSGGWDAFAARFKIEILGITLDEPTK